LSEDPPNQTLAEEALADFNKALELKPDEMAYWMDLVTLLVRLKRDAEVPAVFVRAIALNPDSVPLRAQYAEYLRKSNHTEEGLQQIEEAVRRQKPGDIDAYLAKADYFENMNDLTEARKSLDKAKEINDSDYRIYSHLASLLFRQRRFDEALESMRTGLTTVSDRLAKATEPSDVRRLEEASWQMNFQLAMLILDRFTRQEKQPDTAQADVQKCLDAMIRIAPDHRGNSKVAGLLAYVQGDMRKAVNLLEQSVKEAGAVDSMTAASLSMALMRLQEPTRAQAVLEEITRKGGPQLNPVLSLLTAELKMMGRDFAGADVEIAKVLQASPDNNQAWSLKYVLDVLMGDRSPVLPDKVVLSPLHVGMLVERAMQLYSDHRGADALALMKSLHVKAPTNRVVISWLLDAYLSNDMADRAEDLRKEAQADPALAAWIGDEIDIRSQKDPHKRFELLQTRLERDASVKGAAKELTLARFAGQCGLAKEAEDHVQAAVKIDPNNFSVVDLSFVRSAGRGDWKAAEEWAARAQALNADGMDGHWYAARLAMARSLWSQAIEHLNEVARFRPDSKQVRVMQAECYVNLGDLDKAQALCLSVLKLDRSFYSAVRVMAALTAKQNKIADHEYYVTEAAKLPQSRDDEYIRQENLKIIERLDDPKKLGQRIEERIKLFQKDENNLDNAYHLGILFERAQHAAESARDANEAKVMARNAEMLFRVVFDKAPANAKVDGAKPLASYYGRNKKKSELLTFLDELGKLPDIDRLDLQILAGDALSYVDPATAEAAYKEGLNRAPNAPRAYKALGAFYERQERWPDAIAIYKRYRELAPSDKSFLLVLASAQIQGGDLGEAEKELAEILATDPANPEGMGLTGLLAMKQRRFDDAAKAFDAALQGGGLNIGALLGRARLNLILGHPDKARLDLQTVRQATSDAGTTVQYAQVCRSLGDYQSAELAYLDVLSRQADFTPAVMGLVDLYMTEGSWVKLEKQLAEAKRAFAGDPSYLLAESQMWKLRGDPLKSLESLQAAFKLAPESYPVLYEYLMKLLEAKQYDKVIALCKEYAPKPATHVQALAIAGRALVRSQKVTEGEASFVAALKEKVTLSQAILLSQQAQLAYSSPKAACDAANRWVREANLSDAYTKAFLGDVYAGAKDDAAAVRYLTEARSAAVAKEDKANIGFMLGLAYYQAKNFPGAQQAYEEVLKINPDELGTLNNLAYLFANDLKDPQRALPHARRAMELAIGNANVVDTYGWVLIESKNYAEGIEALRRAVAITGSNPIYRYHMGFAFEQDNQLQEALKNYEEGLKATVMDDETRASLKQGADRVRNKLKPE
jgi:tetratricopeptide (TPR) repeat protein